MQARLKQKLDTLGIIFTEDKVVIQGDFFELSKLLSDAMKADSRLIDLFSDALGQVVSIQ